MDRKTLIAGLKAYRDIEARIAQKRTFAQEAGDPAPYEREIETLRQVKRDMTCCVNALPEKEGASIWEHYIMGETWVRVARKHRYSERHIRNIAARGLEKLGPIVERYPAVVTFCEAHTGA